MNLSHAFGAGLSDSIEVEVPIGKIFSLPPDTICIASAIGVFVQATTTLTYTNGKQESTVFALTGGTNSSNMSLTSLSVRYYF